MSTVKHVLQVAQIVPSTEAEGPGRRLAIWLQGCPLRCPGCCNPQMLPFEGGTPTRLETLLTKIADAQRQHRIEGVTLLGGEPFAHAVGAAPLAAKVQRRGLSVMIFTGYLLEDLRRDALSEVAALLRNTDILVDGPYLQELPEPERRWIGSSNQRIHFLTERYDESDERWQQRNTLEIRLRHGELSVNGFPAHRALGIWKRPKVTHRG
jgi:anaerobic ribonucleoside-triphosphate reductase activating protein